MRVVFDLERITKGAIRYSERLGEGVPSSEAKIGTLYIRKTALKESESFPETVTVVVSW